MSNTIIIARSDERRVSPLSQLARMRPHERRLFTAALPIIVAARVGLSLFPLRRATRLMLHLAEAIAAPQAHTDYAERAARAVSCAGRLVPGADSLTLALATLTLLRRRGLTGRLRRGVRRDSAGVLHTHAWVEHNGRLIVGGPRELVAAYTPLKG